ICFPHLHISIVDSLNKRIGFLNHLADQLELDNVTFYHSRAEDFGKNAKYRETFDVVMARAVARSEEHTSELQSRFDLVCRPLLLRSLVCSTLSLHDALPI